MSRATLAGFIFTAMFLLVCVALYVSRKPTIPVPKLSNQQAHIANPSYSTPESEPPPPAISPPRKTSAESEAAVSVPIGTYYAVDSGLFQDRNNADALAVRMPQKYHTEITPMNFHGRRLYRVRTIVPTEADANALVTELAHDPNLHARISAIHPKSSAEAKAAASVDAVAHYTVDSGLFQDRSNADALAAQIPQQYRTEITPMNVHGRKLYRVRTLVPNEEDADALATKLSHDLKLHALITPIHKP